MSKNKKINQTNNLTQLNTIEKKLLNKIEDQFVKFVVIEFDKTSNHNKVELINFLKMIIEFNSKNLVEEICEILKTIIVLNKFSTLIFEAKKSSNSADRNLIEIYEKAADINFRYNFNNEYITSLKDLNVKPLKEIFKRAFNVAKELDNKSLITPNKLIILEKFQKLTKQSLER